MRSGHGVTPRAQHRQVLEPGTHGPGVLSTHYPSDLPKVIQIVSHPGGKQLAQSHRAQLWVQATSLEIRRLQVERFEASDVRLAQLGKGVQQLNQ